MHLKIGLAALLLVSIATPAAAQKEKVIGGERACTAAVKERLSRMRVDPNDVRSISISTRRRATRGGSKKGLGRSSSTSEGFDGWVRLKSCSGHLVVNLDRECRATRAYARGDCKGRF